VCVQTYEVIGHSPAPRAQEKYDYSRDSTVKFPQLEHKALTKLRDGLSRDDARVAEAGVLWGPEIVLIKAVVHFIVAVVYQRKPQACVRCIPTALHNLVHQGLVVATGHRLAVVVWCIWAGVGGWVSGRTAP
jgi:hypothetical protein